MNENKPITTDLGAVTAYAAAVEKGYTGTQDDFGQLLANFARSAQQVADDREAVKEMKNAVDQAANSFDIHVEEKKTEASESISAAANTAKEESIAAIQEASTSGVKSVLDKTSEGVKALEMSSQTGVSNITAAVEEGKKNFVTDNTLAIPGRAADAKVTGDKIGKLKEDLVNNNAFNVLYNLFNDKYTENAYWNVSNGKIKQYNAESYRAYDPIRVNACKYYTSNKALSLGEFSKVTDKYGNVLCLLSDCRRTEFNGYVWLMPDNASYIYQTSNNEILNQVIFEGNLGDITSLQYSDYPSGKQYKAVAKIELFTKDGKSIDETLDSVRYVNRLRPKDCTNRAYGGTLLTNTDDEVKATLTTVTDSNLSFNKSISVNNGNFVFVRAKVTFSKTTEAKVYVLGGNIILQRIWFEKDVPKNVYLKSVFSTDGTVDLQIQFRPLNVDNNIDIIVNDFCIALNSYEAWWDTKSFVTLPNFNTSEFIVDANGNGHFDNIPEAVDYLKHNFDVNNIPLTIKVLNGEYIQHPSNIAPSYVPIFKGANKISIIGESKDGVVIRSLNTESSQSKIMEIGGDCTVANFTIINEHDSTYTVENDMGRNPYCIHNDLKPSDVSKPYRTVVKNVKMINYCDSPIGAGLQHNQTQVYEDCEFICKSDIRHNGALYIHSPSSANATVASVEVRNCSCEAYDGKKAINMDNTTTGSLKYENILCTFQRNILYTNGEIIGSADFRSTHNISPASALNTFEAMNY